MKKKKKNIEEGINIFSMCIYNIMFLTLLYKDLIGGFALDYTFCL